MTRMTPRIMSEVSGRFTGMDDSVRALFSLEEITMSGEELEKLACAIWMIGYGEALGDIVELPGRTPDVTPLMKIWGFECD